MPINTNPFESLSREQRDLIEKAYNDGLTTEEIGVKYGLDYDDVRNYCENFISTPKSHIERLTGIVCDLEDAALVAKTAIDEGEEDMPKLMTSYQKIMSELRIASTDLDGLKKPIDIVNDIVERVLNPLVIDIIKTSTEEISRLQESLIAANVPAGEAKEIAQDTFKSLTSNLKDTLDHSSTQLSLYYGIRKKSIDG